MTEDQWLANTRPGWGEGTHVVAMAGWWFCNCADAYPPPGPKGFVASQFLAEQMLVAGELCRLLGWGHLEAGDLEKLEAALKDGFPNEPPRRARARLLLLHRPPGLGAADVFRDVVGNPFRPVSLQDVLPHLTPEVKALARSIHEDSNFEDMPILADALEEAGSANATLLDHLRAPQEHTWACWALALVLGASDPARLTT
ncbi:MAG: hypothetical protein L0Z62_22665 [Gemmataceae bacterium]|nr:hypothetical protein [Gemmataceae bacterium]